MSGNSVAAGQVSYYPTAGLVDVSTIQNTHTILVLANGHDHSGGKKICVWKIIICDLYVPIVNKLRFINLHNSFGST